MTAARQQSSRPTAKQHAAQRPAAGLRSATRFQAPSAPLLSRRGASLFGLVLILAVVYPVVENWSRRPRDNFPLSYYPMFSQKRGETVKVAYVIGVDRDGNEQHLPRRVIGSGGHNQVRRQINRAVKRGWSDELCREVASRVAARREKYPDVTTIKVVRGSFGIADFMHHQISTPRKRVTHATCSVRSGEA
ncbi:MAG: hypothetical protein MJD61_11580 [Proteobacteria bacterium]|nr:hypothetical protein [Pseudomonadota bacterium]